jgi:hypothetical protein
MPSMLSHSRIILLAAVASGFAAIATPVEAQQPPTNPSPSATPAPYQNQMSNGTADRKSPCQHSPEGEGHDYFSITQCER